METHYKPAHRVYWNEAKPVEYYIAQPKQWFEPDIAYSLERYVWTRYRGVRLSRVMRRKGEVIVGILGPRGSRGIGVAAIPDELTMTKLRASRRAFHHGLAFLMEHFAPSHEEESE